jgi:DnaK suppressor protein
MINSTQLETFKLLLLARQAEMLELEKTGEDATKTVELDQACVGRLSRIDALQSQAMSVETMRRRQLQLSKIGTALQRIANNEFGFCLHCAEEIDYRRLEYDPAAALCIDCANKAEL